MKQWLAIYTKPRWEKKVHTLLLAKGITAYCPLNKVYKQWSDRIKKVEEPLFKSYVFVQVSESEKAAVRMTDGVLNFVYWLGKPAVVKDKEIEAIRLFLSDYEDVETVAISHLQPGAEVMVGSGLMMGATGIIEKIDNRWAEVTLESIGFKLRAKIATKKLKVIRKKPEGGKA